MWEDYTFYKNEDGAIYGVSPRVINGGFVPAEGHKKVTKAERKAFIDKVVKLKKLPRPANMDEIKAKVEALKKKEG